MADNTEILLHSEPVFRESKGSFGQWNKSIINLIRVTVPEYQHITIWQFYDVSKTDLWWWGVCGICLCQGEAETVSFMLGKIYLK